VLLAAYPICMAFSLVYTGEHFVTDIFVGWIYVAITMYFGSKLLDRWEARRRRKQLGATLDHGPAMPLDSLEPDTPLVAPG
jgi:membrane-associated phospholipid phosphatase